MDFQLLHYFLTKFKITYFYNYLKKLTDIIISKKDIFLGANYFKTKIPFITEWDFTFLEPSFLTNLISLIKLLVGFCQINNSLNKTNYCTYTA